MKLSEKRRVAKDQCLLNNLQAKYCIFSRQDER